MTGPRVQLLPFFLVALGALGALKAGGLWVSFASAAAETSPPAASAPCVDTRRSPTAERLIEQLAEREKALDARAAELETREKVLAAAELRVETAMKALAAEKQAVATESDGRAKLRDDEFAALSSAYERMKARDAARIFEILDDDILLPVAAGMRTQALAGVLAEMSAERAKHLTIALASRGRPAIAPAPTP
ncbi:MAG: MotE family protein [Parvularculaceae bacterium]